MFTRIKMISLVASVLMSAAVVAQTPASAPAGSTGLCRDGSYWTGATKQGACHGHKGVQDWYGAAGSAGAAAGGSAAATAAPPAVTTAAPPATSIAATPAATPAATSKASPAPTAPQAPGGGPGQVWVNSSSKVYHCPSDPWYGKTKTGAYMTESAAIAQGNHADHDKGCK